MNTEVCSNAASRKPENRLARREGNDFARTRTKTRTIGTYAITSISQVFESMVQVRGETSNRLFQVLGEWNAILQGSPLYVANLQVDSKMLNPHGL